MDSLVEHTYMHRLNPHTYIFIFNQVSDQPNLAFGNAA